MDGDNKPNHILSFLKSEGFSPLQVTDDFVTPVDSENWFTKQIGNYEFRAFVCYQTNPMRFAFESRLDDELISKDYNGVIMDGVEDLKLYFSRAFDYNRVLGNIASKYF